MEQGEIAISPLREGTFSRIIGRLWSQVTFEPAGEALVGIDAVFAFAEAVTLAWVDDILVLDAVLAELFDDGFGLDGRDAGVLAAVQDQQRRPDLSEPVVG
jgi:hypothetical protein